MAVIQPPPAFLGYCDGRDAEPWRQCPMTYEAYLEGRAETPAVLAYWRGFELGVSEQPTKGQ